MAYNGKLAERIGKALTGERSVVMKEMFGGVAFMVQGKMAVGVIKDDLMLRLDPADAEKALKEPHVRPMDFTGRPMKGYVYVAPAGYKSDAALKKWVAMSATYAAGLAKGKKK